MNSICDYGGGGVVERQLLARVFLCVSVLSERERLSANQYENSSMYEKWK